MYVSSIFHQTKTTCGFLLSTNDASSVQSANSESLAAQERWMGLTASCFALCMLSVEGFPDYPSVYKVRVSAPGIGNRNLLRDLSHQVSAILIKRMLDLAFIAFVGREGTAGGFLGLASPGSNIPLWRGLFTFKFLRSGFKSHALRHSNDRHLRLG